MQDNKIADNVIWENYIPDDDEADSTMFPGGYSQPQMMFCWKCGKPIPANSKFCPYCQIELYVKCPQCDIEYSSQYPSCNQCGTNRESYLLEKERQKQLKEQQRLQKEKEEKEEKEEKATVYKKCDRIKVYDDYIVNKCYFQNGVGEEINHMGQWYEDLNGNKITNAYVAVRYLNYGYTAECKDGKWAVGYFTKSADGKQIVQGITDFKFDQIDLFGKGAVVNGINLSKDVQCCAKVRCGGEMFYLGMSADKYEYYRIQEVNMYEENPEHSKWDLVNGFGRIGLALYWFFWGSIFMFSWTDRDMKVASLKEYIQYVIEYLGGINVMAVWNIICLLAVLIGWIVMSGISKEIVIGVKYVVYKSKDGVKWEYCTTKELQVKK